VKIGWLNEHEPGLTSRMEGVEGDRKKEGFEEGLESITT